ncbi:hypothetical protein [uncultured Roseobacter sp.]|uniref:hypothetical protein n=1 Tax=uncultured Roseobacter sp. TaxID=114847 RepID=UPI00260C75D1|nr:hypothetical protein [uncultured Roseobacter sp.]
MPTLIEAWDEHGEPILSTFDPFRAGIWFEGHPPVNTFSMFIVKYGEMNVAFIVKRELFGDFSRWVAQYISDNTVRSLLGGFGDDETGMEYLTRIGAKIIAKPLFIRYGDMASTADQIAEEERAAAAEAQQLAERAYHMEPADRERWYETAFATKDSASISSPAPTAASALLTIVPDYGESGLEAGLSEMLEGIRHLCDLSGLDFYKIMDNAYRQYIDAVSEFGMAHDIDLKRAIEEELL